MIYVEYHNLYKKFKEAENSYYDSLDKKSQLLHRVEPHTSNYNPMKVMGGSGSADDAIIEYSAEIKGVDNLINETRNTKDVLERELKKKEIELRASDEVYDKIYVYKWIEHKKSKYFCKLINYSKRQTDRKIKEIENTIYPELKERRERLQKQIEEKRNKERELFQKVFKS